MSASTLADRIRAIREAEGLSRQAAAEMAGIPLRTLEGIEQKRRVPGGDILEKVATTWPKYAYWLVTGEQLNQIGQVCPVIRSVEE